MYLKNEMGSAASPHPSQALTPYSKHTGQWYALNFARVHSNFVIAAY